MNELEKLSIYAVSVMCYVALFYLDPNSSMSYKYIASYVLVGSNLLMNGVFLRAIASEYFRWITAGLDKVS